MTLTTGNLDLNEKDIVMDSDATLAETGGRVLGTGSISTTRTLNNITSENIAGLGAEISTSENMGSTVILRGHVKQTIDGNESIQRYYDIAPTSNSGLNATLVFRYNDAELDGKTESSLILFRSADAGVNWTGQGGTVDTESNTITLSSIDAFSRWTADHGHGQVELKVVLEGPYNAATDSMNADLYNAGLIPTTSPYAADARTIDDIPDNTVDWVLVELRVHPDSSATVAKSALLHKDGRIVADDGTTSYIQMEAADGDYYLVVKHRNHIAVCSAAAHTLSSSSSTLYDFTTGTSQYYGGDAVLVDSSPTVYAMYDGDTDGSGTVDADDRTATWNNKNNTTYHGSDCCLTGTVDADDRTATWNNRNKSTAVE